MNLSGYIRHVTVFNWMLAIACCLVVALGLGLALDLVSGWLVVCTRICTSFRFHCHTAGRVEGFAGTLGWVAERDVLVPVA